MPRGATVDAAHSKATTHTLAINATSQTRRYINHERALDRDYFFNLRGQEAKALDVMSEFLDMFHAESDRGGDGEGHDA